MKRFNVLTNLSIYIGWVYSVIVSHCVYILSVAIYHDDTSRHASSQLRKFETTIFNVIGQFG